MRYVILLAVLIAAACSRRAGPTPAASDPDVEPRVQVLPAEFRGWYAAGFEQESFSPCGSFERWWVANPDGLRRHYEAVGARPYQPVYAVVLGDTSRAGYVGHLGLYRRYLRVTHVVSVVHVDSLAPDAAVCRGARASAADGVGDPAARSATYHERRTQ